MANEVTVFNGENPQDEFPILKAFQEYITEEQNKARKRMVGLAVFFAILMFVVVGVFVAITFQMSMRNQQLNDRLVEFAMRGRLDTQQPQTPVIVNQPAPMQDNSVMKAMVDALSSLEKRISATEEKKAEEIRIMESEKAKAEAEKVALEKLALEKEKLEAERKAFKAEQKRKAIEDKKRAHEEEVERQRRRLYPEYYAKQDAAKAEPPPQPKAEPQPRTFSQQDIDDILNEVPEEQDDEVVEAPMLEAVSYFDDEDDKETEERK